MKTDEFTSSLIIHFSFQLPVNQKKSSIIYISSIIPFFCFDMQNSLFTLQDNIPKTTIL